MRNRIDKRRRPAEASKTRVLVCTHGTNRGAARAPTEEGGIHETLPRGGHAGPLEMPTGASRKARFSAGQRNRASSARLHPRVCADWSSCSRKIVWER